MKTMYEEYGEPDDKHGKHKCCNKCGCCIDCGDCDEYGCGLDNKSTVKLKTSSKNKDLELFKKTSEMVIMEDKRLLEELGRK